MIFILDLKAKDEHLMIHHFNCTGWWISAECLHCSVGMSLINRLVCLIHPYLFEIGNWKTPIEVIFSIAGRSGHRFDFSRYKTWLSLCNRQVNMSSMHAQLFLYFGPSNHQLIDKIEKVVELIRSILCGFHTWFLCIFLILDWDWRLRRRRTCLIGTLRWVFTPVRVIIAPVFGLAV